MKDFIKEKFIYLKNVLTKKNSVILIIGIIIFIIIIAVTLLLILRKDQNAIQEEMLYLPFTNLETNSTTFFNSNGTYSLELSNIYNLQQFTPTDNTLLELRSDKNLNVFISQKDIISDKSLKDVVLADQLAFTENFQTISNISEIKELTINENNGCTYSFHYLDENINTTFYIQVTWIQINNNYFVFDIEFPVDDINNYTSLITDVLSNFKLISLNNISTK